MSMATLSLEPTYKLDTTHSTPKHFIVVGAGGNGGYYIPQLVRQVALDNKVRELSRRSPHRITIIDADEVEDKNLTRQNFLQRDVGSNKAAVLADRYGRAFGIEIEYIDAYLEDEKMLKSIIASHRGTIPVIVGAVDNNKTRALMYNVFNERRNTFYLDAGNEEWGGQVVLGYNYSRSNGVTNYIPHKEHKGNPHGFDLPCIADMFPEVLEATDKLPSEMSCAERAVSNPQNIYTNMTAANIMIGFTNQLLSGEGIQQYAVVFNAESLSFKTHFNKISELKAYTEPRPAPATPEEEVKTVEKAEAKEETKEEEAAS